LVRERLGVRGLGGLGAVSGGQSRGGLMPGASQSRPQAASSDKLTGKAASVAWLAALDNCGHSGDWSGCAGWCLTLPPRAGQRCSVHECQVELGTWPLRAKLALGTWHSRATGSLALGTRAQRGTALRDRAPSPSEKGTGDHRGPVELAWSPAATLCSRGSQVLNRPAAHGPAHHRSP
jgi:hypothetical protein